MRGPKHRAWSLVTPENELSRGLGTIQEQPARRLRTTKHAKSAKRPNEQPILRCFFANFVYFVVSFLPRARVGCFCTVPYHGRLTRILVSVNTTKHLPQSSISGATASMAVAKAWVPGAKRRVSEKSRSCVIQSCCSSRAARQIRSSVCPVKGTSGTVSAWCPYRPRMSISRVGRFSSSLILRPPPVVPRAADPRLRRGRQRR